MSTCDRIKWQTLGSTALTVALLILYSQTIAANQVSAEANASPPKRSPPQKRASSRMGVSVVVLPTCALRVGNIRSRNGQQPVEVLCTSGAEYGLSMVGGVGRDTLTRSAISSTPAAGRVVRKGNGRKDLFWLERAQTSQQNPPNEDGVTVITIDF